MLIKKIICKIKRFSYYLCNCNSYGYLSKSAWVMDLLRIDGKSNIFIHDNVVVQKQSWLAAVPLASEAQCRLEIGRGVIIGNFNHIYATRSIVIEADVLTADKVYISDNLHSYEDVSAAIMHQPIKQLKAVVIGRGAWLGENVCVIGASVGRGSIVGANSVVTRDIPDFCVAVGSPARVIKKYNKGTQNWEKIDI